MYKGLASVGAIALLIASCSSGSSDTTAGSSLFVTTTVESGESGQKQYTDINGNFVNIERGVSARPLVMWFWAPG